MLLWIGLALVVLGVLLFLVGRRANVSASSSSVAVGGGNKGVIINQNNSMNVGQPAQHGAGHGKGLTYVSIVVELAGIATTLYHLYHQSLPK